jgi:hypothetical protein
MIAFGRGEQYLEGAAVSIQLPLDCRHGVESGEQEVGRGDHHSHAIVTQRSQALDCLGYGSGAIVDSGDQVIV